VSAILAYLQTEENNPNNPVRGFTHTELPPAESVQSIFHGFWYNDTAVPLANGDMLGVGWYPDKIMLLMIDYDLVEKDSLERALHEMQRIFEYTYLKYQSPQAEFWIVAEPVMRFTR
jgi:hypothetical protein